MPTKYIPAWTTAAGDRLIVIAGNHLFDSWAAAFEYQMGNCLFYIPLGLAAAGIVEIEMDPDGTTSLAYLSARGPFGFEYAIIGGPRFEASR